ncbi:cyclin-dependent kinase inhibitor 3 family protein [Motilimonas sp. 1_MG-2023]|uniref:cyclin-dependent kinase inhibitor 3 family protein n=1 Tax=Motilimonas TaxID=1914248 RepID=UPI0026E45B95|nr:cyclin-dependent kinase inhibitor 3 family protein [Motilimonas sp. 1_MG-2023]MDO6525304.1 cyclin-dependent kinase inhibitor 3 family protein [Motilimonas sp. 1_MG-2023]
MTHPTWQLPLNNQGAELVLTPCPGTKGTDLESSLRQLKDRGVKAVVTALNEAEMEKAGVAELSQLTQSLGMQWFHCPIEDDQAPDANFKIDWLKASPELHQLLDNNQAVALHCMGGSGRTGLLAAHILLERGWDLDTIKKRVQALRPGAFTKAVQIDYVDQLVTP